MWSGEDPRVYCILSKEFLDDGNGNVCGVKTVKVEWTPGEGGRWHMAEVPGTEKTYEADYVFLGAIPPLLVDLHRTRAHTWPRSSDIGVRLS